MFTKLGRNEVLMSPHMHLGVSARFAQGRIQGGAKIGHRVPLLQETSSSDRKATATNQMDSNDLEACGKKCCYFWFHSEVKYLIRGVNQKVFFSRSIAVLRHKTERNLCMMLQNTLFSVFLKMLYNE